MENFVWRQNLKICRKNLGLTQAQLALRIGRTQQTINNWEGGINDPSLEDIARLTIIFGISIDQFFNDVQVIDKNKDAKNRKNVQLNVQGNVQPNGTYSASDPPKTMVVNEPDAPYGTTPTAPSWLTEVIEAQSATVTTLQTALTQALRRIATLEKNAKK